MTATLHLLWFYVHFLSFYPSSILNFKCWSFALACQNTNAPFFLIIPFFQMETFLEKAQEILGTGFSCLLFFFLLSLFLSMPNWPLRWYYHLPKIHSKKGARKIVQFLLFPYKAGLSVSKSFLTDVCLSCF